MDRDNRRMPAIYRLGIILWIAALLTLLASCVPDAYKPRYGKHYTRQQVKALKAIDKCPAHLR